MERTDASISRSRTATLLMALAASPDPLMLKELKGEVSNSVVRDLVDQMELDGLVDIVVTTRPRKTVWVSLTPAGKRVSAIMSMVNEDIGGGPVAGKSLDLRRTDAVLALLSDGPAGIREVKRAASSYRTAVKVLAALEREGLAVVDPPGARRRYARLTEEGEIAAKAYSMMHQIIDEQREAPRDLAVLEED